MKGKSINTEEFSISLRRRVVDLTSRQLFVTNFADSFQKKDLTTPPNCDGFGRIRHFYRNGSASWIQDPLPIDPATNALELQLSDSIHAQVFQLGACNWRCWYCYVDYALLSADKRHGAWFTTDALVELYLKESDRPSVIDLTGGQPDIVPEWVPWMMRSLQTANLDTSTYLWSDDNLSTDYFWQYLTDDDIELIASYKNYGRVCCFKGFDEVSFTFNTSASSELFGRQFELFSRLAALGIDMYAYVTLTTPDDKMMNKKMAEFVDRLQDIDPILPLKTVPLEIKMYKTNSTRFRKVHPSVIDNQYKAIHLWKEELYKRFSSDELNKNIAEL